MVSSELRIKFTILALLISFQVNCQKKYLYEKGTYRIYADTSLKFKDTIYHKKVKGFYTKKTDTFYKKNQKKVPVYNVTKYIYTKGRYRLEKKLYFEDDTVNTTIRKFKKTKNEKDYIVIERYYRKPEKVYLLKELNKRK